MADPKDTQDTDGVENPRMTGDSADQMFDDDTMEDADPADSRQERVGGRGGLSGGAGHIAGVVRE